jgi:hypothetical protein
VTSDAEGEVYSRMRKAIETRDGEMGAWAALELAERLSRSSTEDAQVYATMGTAFAMLYAGGGIWGQFYQGEPA